MHKDNKSIMGAIIVIILLAFISLDLTNPTGGVTRDHSSTQIDLSPEAIFSGQQISITISPGNQGVNEKVSFYQAEDNLRKVSVSNLCTAYKCTKQASFTFTIPNNWENGVYYVQVYDYGLKDFVKKEFTVKNK